jgi:hypothetical protein
MSWWDSFTNYVSNQVVPFWSSLLGSSGVGDSPAVTGALAQSLAYQQYGARGQVGQAMAEEVGRVSRKRGEAVQSFQANVFFTPGREFRNVVQTPFQAIASGSNLFDAYSLVRGDRSKVQWYEPGREGISFAQSVYGGLSALVPGEQAADQIDWTNNKEVRDYFDNGPAKYLTGGLDAIATLGLDPFIVGGTAAQRTKIKYFVAPIRNAKDLNRAVGELDVVAAGGRNRWSNFVDYIFANKDDEAALLARSNIFESANSDDLAAVLAGAARRNDRQLVIDIIKVGIGDNAALEKLLARKDIAAAEVARLKILEDKYTKGMLAPVNDNLKDIITQAVGKAIDEERILIRTVGKVDPVTGELMGSPGVFMGMKGRTVSRFEKAEFWRNRTASQRSKTMFNEEYLTYESLPVRVITWLNPSGPIKEMPSGMFNLGTAGDQEAWREMLAQTRLLARITGKSGQEYRSIVNQYIRIPTKEQRNDFLMNLEKRMVTDIVESRIVRDRFPGKMSADDAVRYEQQLKAAEFLVDSLMTAKPRIQARVYNDIKRNNYVIFDEDFGDAVVVSQLKDGLKKVADLNGTTYENIIDSLASDPAFGSQAANVYHFMDVGAYDDVIKEYASTIRNFLDILDDELYKANAFGDTLSARQQRDVIKRTIDDIVTNPKGALTNAEKFTSTSRQLYDSAIRLADVYHATIWKPITLISLKYTARNVTESWVRTVSAMYQMSAELGDSTVRAASDWAGNPIKSISRVVNNANQRRIAAKKADLAAKLSPQQRTAALREDGLLDNSTRTMQTSLASLRTIAERISTLKDPSGKRIAQLENWLKSDSKLISSIKNSEVRRFVIMLLDDDVDEALKLIQASQDVSTLSTGLASFRDDIIRIAESFDEPLSNGTYSNYLGKDSVQLIANYQKTLLDTSAVIDRVITTRINSAAAWQEFDKLIVGTNPILRQKDDGTFEVMKGIPVPDWGAGALGTYAKKESAADNTYFNTILSGNRLIGEGAVTRFISNARVNPTEKNWMQSYMRFINEDLRSDALLYRILNTEANPASATDAALLTLLKSRDMKGYRVVTGLQGKSDEVLQAHIESRKLLVEYYLPEIPGMKAGWLKSLVAQNPITDNLVAQIPQPLRVPVSGTEITQGTANHLGFFVNKAVSTIFKYIGSLPETVLARHPFYRMAYRMEARRTARVLDGQGVDITLPKYQSIIQRTAHKAAQKQLNETLYTISRRSDFAQFMRFASPFYMANQNSQRFWLGSAFKNPALPQLGLLAWNTPNKIFEVVDSQGNPVESSLPYFSDEMIYITLPEGIAKFLGQDQVYFYKTSFDLITNGALPVAFQASGPLLSAPITALLKQVNIGKYATDLGYNGDFVEEKIAPYLDPYTSTTEALFPRPAWYRAFMNFQGDTPQFASRVNLIAEQAFMEADLNGVVLSDEDRANIIKESAETARKTYFTEMVSTLGVPFVAAPKFTVNQDLLKKEYRRYIRRFGNVNGPVRFEQDYGTVKSVYASSSLSDNPGGLLATPQTLDNLKKNMDFANALASSDKFGDDAFSILGLLFNDGDPEDYSALVNSQFYELKIAGRTLKQQNEDLAAAQRKNEINIGWREYIPFKNMALAIAESKGIRVNTNAWNATFKPALDAKVAEISQKYPSWGSSRGNIDTQRSLNIFYALAKAVNNKGYMKSVGKNNQVALAMREWIPFRNMAANVIQSRGVGITAVANADIRFALQSKAAELSAKYPEFTLVYERFLENDSLELRNNG